MAPPLVLPSLAKLAHLPVRIASFVISGIHLLIRPHSVKAVDSLELSIAFSGMAAGFAIMNCSLVWLLPRYSAPSCILLVVAFVQAFVHLAEPAA